MWSVTVCEALLLVKPADENICLNLGKDLFFKFIFAKSAKWPLGCGVKKKKKRVHPCYDLRKLSFSSSAGTKLLLSWLWPVGMQKACWGHARSTTWALCLHGLLQFEAWHKVNEDQCQIVLWLFISGTAIANWGEKVFPALGFMLMAPCALRQALVPITKSFPCW